MPNQAPRASHTLGLSSHLGRGRPWEFTMDLGSCIAKELPEVRTWGGSRGAWALALSTPGWRFFQRGFIRPLVPVVSHLMEEGEEEWCSPRGSSGC